VPQSGACLVTRCRRVRVPGSSSEKERAVGPRAANVALGRLPQAPIEVGDGGQRSPVVPACGTD